MNKPELVSIVAEKTGLTKKDSVKVLEAVVACIGEALARGGNVQLVGFGTFDVRGRAERKGRNPQTGVEVKIPAAKVPVFKAGKALKEVVSK